MSTITTDAGTVAVRRPQRADARRNFDALLAAAREVFTEQGANASLEEIARRAGVGIATLYRNFPTRDDLVEAVYVDEVERLAVAAREAGDTLEAWAAVQAYLRRFSEYMATKRALIEGFTKDSDVLRSCRAVVYSSGQPILDRAQREGAVRADVSIEDIVKMMAGIAGVAFADEEQRDRVLGLAIDGLRAR